MTSASELFAGPAFEQLVSEITRGRVLAFVGAGFAIPAFKEKSWHGLLRGLAGQRPELAERVSRLIDDRRPTNSELEAAAQMIQDTLGTDELRKGLREQLTIQGELSPTMRSRLEHLASIPFEAVLTTNFDTLLTGQSASPAAFGALLRNPAGHWWQNKYWDRGGSGAPVIKLHGDLSDEKSRIVFSRRDYRARLYQDPSYAGFLRSALATRTVLYLGFSFTDAYLNELRSEVLSMLGHEPGAAPTAYAVMNDVSPELVAYSREHEGIHVFSYGTNEGLKHEAFDHFLAELHARTNPTALLGNVVAGRRILWLDRHAENNDEGRKVLLDAARATESHCSIDTNESWQEAMQSMDASGDRPYDLVLTHWGEGQAIFRNGASCAVAERFLEELRASRHRVPTIVFAARRGADLRKPRALAAGALTYVHEWATLFEEIERVFGPAT